MKTIRASDIGSFLYCQRAWWYRKNGYVSNNPLEISAGSNHHHQHSRWVSVSNLIRLLAYLMILFALVILFLYIF